MANSIDNFLGVHAQALTLESRRTQLLAANIANVDTPNYKARDLDFKAALANAAGAGGNAGGPLALRATNSAHQPGNAIAASNDPALLYRVPMAPALDGNTVDEQLEQAAFAENSVRYQATLTLLGGKLRSLMTAITGQ
ncbi:MAG: flagellar basal body rod protein FlgB [Proteobacteria bacterium]|nr:flagellar basal body rod protein FlgB [Pseudomonadota bacterium]